ncbi:MAG: rhodanese-like domain-containing protein, partial [Syntrophothermus sp.]
MDLLGKIFGKPAPSVSTQELSEKMKSGKRPLVLDVRQPGEYRSGHIAGAKLIPLDQLGSRLK